jgi:hypothetical protein
MSRSIMQGITVAACVVTMLAVAVATSHASFNGKYKTKGDWAVTFDGGGTLKGTFKGGSKLGGKTFDLDSKMNIGCDLTGKGRLDKLPRGNGKTGVRQARFVTDCDVFGSTRFDVKSGKGTLKQTRKGSQSTRLKLKGVGTSGFADKASFKATSRGKG